MIQKSYTRFQFFFSLLIWTPVFFQIQKNLGMSESEIFQIQSIYYLAFCLIEIPTGWLSDKNGHRNSLIISAAILILANLIVFPLPNYWGFLLHWMGVGLARSFVSGAANALLYNELESENRINQYARIEGRARAISLVGKLIAWSLAGWMMTFYLLLPYLLTALASGISLYFAFNFPKSIAHKNTNYTDVKIKSLLQDLKTVSGSLFLKPALIIPMIHGILLFVAARLLTVNLYQPILTAVSIPLAIHGLTMSGITVAEAWGSENAHRWTSRLSNQAALNLLSILACISMILISFQERISSLLGLALFSMIFGVGYPLQKKIFIEALPQKELKATYLSAESIVDRLACSIALFIAGLALESQRLPTFLVTFSVFGLISILTMHFLKSLSISEG